MYVTLLNWTEQGVRNFRDTVDRYEAAAGQLNALGVKFKEIYWTLGDHDMVSVVEGPDDEAVAAALLAVAGAGNIRSRTMRAFSQEEMRGVISRAQSSG